MKRELEKIIIKVESDVLTYAEKEILKQSLNELDELKRDVARFMELDYQDSDGMDDVDTIEYTRLYIKLSKVGKEE